MRGRREICFTWRGRKKTTTLDEIGFLVKVVRTPFLGRLRQDQEQTNHARDIRKLGYITAKQEILLFPKVFIQYSQRQRSIVGTGTYRHSYTGWVGKS